MMQGKITHSGINYYVKVGSITIDITDDVNALIVQEREVHEHAFAAHAAAHADIVNRYNQITRIVLANGAGMPTG